MSLDYLQQNLFYQPYFLQSNDTKTFITNSDSNKELSTDRTETSTLDSKYKTELCTNFTAKGFCKYETRCRFAHGKEELVSKRVNSVFYKQKNCETFFTTGSCPYGIRCTFKHDERKLITIQKPFQYKIIELVKQFKKNYENLEYEESDPNLKANKQMRLSIFTDITDDNVSFDSKKVATKIKIRKELSKQLMMKSNMESMSYMSGLSTLSTIFGKPNQGFGCSIDTIRI